MALPPLTPQQREHALEAARVARKARADVKDGLKAGTLSVAEVLKAASEPGPIGKMRVSALLAAMPGLGKIRAGQVMERLKIDENRRLRGLGPNQREALLEEFGQVPAGA